MEDLVMAALARRMNKSWKWLLPLLLMAVGCSKAPAAEQLTLGSGKTVEILAVGPIQSTRGWSGLMLKYRTLIPLNDLASLRKEVDEIWDRFVVDAEHGGYQTAIISANEPEKGSIVTTSNSYNFVFEKKDGSWRTLESGDRPRTESRSGFHKRVHGSDRLGVREQQHERASSLYGE
jgi:hypothetical protein